MAATVLGHSQRLPGKTLCQAAALALAERAMPDSFFNRLRAAGVLPWMRVTLARGMTRRAFFFCVSTLRAEREPFCAGMT